MQVRLQEFLSMAGLEAKGTVRLQGMAPGQRREYVEVEEVLDQAEVFDGDAQTWRPLNDREKRRTKRAFGIR